MYVLCSGRAVRQHQGMGELEQRGRRQGFALWEDLAVLTANDGQCVYCGVPSQVKDHVIPFARGGVDGLVNLVPTCEECNQEKGDRWLAEYVVWRELPESCRPGEGRPALFGGVQAEFEEMRPACVEVLRRVDSVVAEVSNEARQEWFRMLYASTHFGSYPSSPSRRTRVAACRYLDAEEIRRGGESGWPAWGRSPFRILQKGGPIDRRARRRICPTAELGFI